MLTQFLQAGSVDVASAVRRVVQGAVQGALRDAGAAARVQGGMCEAHGARGGNEAAECVVVTSLRDRAQTCNLAQTRHEGRLSHGDRREHSGVTRTCAPAVNSTATARRFFSHATG